MKYMHSLYLLLGMFSFLAAGLYFSRGVFSHFARGAGTEAVFLETESAASVTAPALVKTDDPTASGGSYIEFLGNTPPPTTTYEPKAPYYTTFYYPWFQNPLVDGFGKWGAWDDNGKVPENGTWFSNYLPDLDPTVFDYSTAGGSTELYSSNDYNAFKWQLQKMKDAHLEVAVSSWWGQAHRSDVAFRKVVTDFMDRSDVPYADFRWVPYYEKEFALPDTGNPPQVYDPSPEEIATDLKYLLDNYVSHSGYMKINGRPVIFVYAGSSAAGDPDTTDVAERWKAAKELVKAERNVEFYVVLKLYSGYATDVNQPDSWHQYAPAVRYQVHKPHSAFVSPGFWLESDVSPRLIRDPADFENQLKTMVALPASDAKWRMIQTWNEWGEGTAVEPGTNVDKSQIPWKAGPNSPEFGNRYIDIMNSAIPDPYSQ